MPFAAPPQMDALLRFLLILLARRDATVRASERASERGRTSDDRSRRDLLLTEIMTAIKTGCDSARLKIKTSRAAVTRKELKYLKQDTAATALKH